MKRGAPLRRLRLREIELVLAIHDRKSITAAASELGLTQPAASRALREIEQLLRVHLFERDRAKGMVPTAAGELVVGRARELVADYRSLSAEIDAYRAGTGGQLRLGIIPFVAAPLIGRLIAGLTGERGQMSIAIVEGSTTSLIEELRMQRLDAVIGRCLSAPLPPGLSQEAMLRQEGCLLVPAQSALGRAGRLRLAHLDGFAWLLPPEGTPTRAAINDVYRRARLVPPVATVEASSMRIIHLALKANPRMLSVVPADLGDDIQRLGGVRRVPFPVPLNLPPVGLLVATRHRDRPAVRHLRDRMREIAREQRED